VLLPPGTLKLQPPLLAAGVVEPVPPLAVPAVGVDVVPAVGVDVVPAVGAAPPALEPLLPAGASPGFVNEQ